jgi:hypothetical protein
LGALFLLDNLGIHVFRYLGKFWPVLLILIGLAMLQRRMGRGSQTGPEPPGPPKESSSNFPGPSGI